MTSLATWHSYALEGEQSAAVLRWHLLPPALMMMMMMIQPYRHTEPSQSQPCYSPRKLHTIPTPPPSPHYPHSPAVRICKPNAPLKATSVLRCARPHPHLWISPVCGGRNNGLSYLISPDTISAGRKCLHVVPPVFVLDVSVQSASCSVGFIHPRIGLRYLQPYAPRSWQHHWRVTRTPLDRHGVGVGNW